jgi:hypothetical protein
VDDRRTHTRFPTKVVFGIETAVRDDRAGVTQDISAGGALFYSLSAFEVGERLRMWCRDPNNDDCKIEMDATVLRVSRENRPVILRHLAAVRFDKPVARLAN